MRSCRRSASPCGRDPPPPSFLLHPPAESSFFFFFITQSAFVPLRVGPSGPPMDGSLPRHGFTGPLRAHDPARHSLSGPARNHLPGHVPSSGSRTVLTLRLGIPDHGSPFDHFVARPLLSGGAQCPGPDSDGPDTTVTSPSRSGRAQRPARTRLDPESRTHLGPPVTPHGPAPRGTAGPNASRTPGQATRKANCGRAEAAPSRCRRVPPGCHNDRAGC